MAKQQEYFMNNLVMFKRIKFKNALNNSAGRNNRCGKNVNNKKWTVLLKPWRFGNKSNIKL